MFIIHIGRPKAGSSSIQHFLHSNADELLQLGVIYSDIGKGQGAAHHPLAAVRHSKNSVESAFRNWSDLTELGRRNPDKQIVVSSEALSFVNRKHTRQVRKLLGDAPATIVVYVRDTSAAVTAHYNQSTKRGNNLDDFDTYFARRDVENRYDLLARIETWAEAFGWPSIRVRALDSRNLVGGDLIEDFLSVCGVSLAELGVVDAKGLRRRNVSDGWKTVEVIRQLHLALRAELDGASTAAESIRESMASRIHTICKKVMSDLDLDAERAIYMSKLQRNVCNSVYAREVEKLNDKMGGAIIPAPELDAGVERPFLPVIDRIPARERQKIAARLEARLVSRLGRAKSLGGVEMTPELRQALLTAVNSSYSSRR